MEASQSGAIIIVDEAVDEGVSLFVGVEAVSAGVYAVGGVAGEGFGDAAVETFDHAVGLWMVRPGQLVGDVVRGADAVESVVSGAAFSCAVKGAAEAVGELGAIAH